MLAAAVPWAAVFVITGGMAVLVVVLAAYSYIAWRDDPNQHALGR